MFFKRKREIEEARDYYSMCLEDFINRTHSSMKSLIKENKELKERINKAIETLKLCNSHCAKETIEILKGDSNER